MSDRTNMQILVHPEDTPLVLLAMCRGELRFFTKPNDLLPGSWTSLEDCDYGGVCDWEVLAKLGIRFLATHDSGYDYPAETGVSNGFALRITVMNDNLVPAVSLYRMDLETNRIEAMSLEDKEEEIREVEVNVRIWNSVLESIENWKRRFKSHVDNQ